MDAEDLNKMYGNDYPAAAVVNGVRVPLARETLFSRYYRPGDSQTDCYLVSRFMDGSASMTLATLQRDWATWAPVRRVDFCQSCAWLSKQPDFADMLRFIMAQGGSEDWSAIAGQIAMRLPQEEAFRFLLGALRATDFGRASNVIQAIAMTKHPDSEATLRQHLWTVWERPDIWSDDDFLNWVASEAEKCIEYLIEGGASPADFEQQVRRLSQHVCRGNRDSCRRCLSKYYSWLK